MSEEGKALEVTDADFEEKILKADEPALVDFWAPWCGPCRIQGPTVEKVAEKFDGRAIVAKINVDENPDASSKYGVMSIPTIIVFKGGSELQRFVGVRQEKELAEALEKALQ
jgi:thioredoxin 1